MAEKKKPRIPVYFLTGLLLAVLCSAVIIAALTAPYERVKTYLNILFMDQKKITPSTGVNGLVITENENIPTEADGTQAQTELLESGEIIRPSFGEQYAVLNIESAGINAPVYWGSSTELLERGACQTTSSVVIGEEGNVVIDAHVNTFFASLHDVAVGDTVVLYTEYGVFTYEARELVTFQNTDKKYVIPSEEDKLTLYTCEAQVLGTSATRIGVVCAPVSKLYYPAGEKEAAE